ncbi:MAG: inosose dehydratase [Acidobacteriaceae bacterium]|jgi:inosose dehydratase|nr:inosose dehydratase [Acidobacteriaceae bacterium]
MIEQISRRTFCKGLTMTAAVSMAQGPMPGSRHIAIGHTGITWQNRDVANAIADISSQGFYGFETFGDVLEQWEKRPGGLGEVLQRNSLPLISAYCAMNLTDADRRKDEVAKAVRWATIVKKYGGRVAVIGPNGVDRATYDFAAHKADIVASLNEICQAVMDVGITPALHQHTGTCVESREETYSVLESVNTRYVRFGPDIGQLTKGGADATKVVQDFLPLIEHMHLKDFNGENEHFSGYCPLGKGKVNVPAILTLMEGRKLHGMVMVELDNDGKTSAIPLDLLKESKSYLAKQGVHFRS